MKEFVRTEVRGYLALLKYAAIWGGAFVIAGRAAEVAVDPELTRIALLATLLAATTITYLVSKRF